MGCTRCGTDTKLIELMFTKLVQEALKDGTLQAGLVDCSEKRLEKNTNVVTCNALEDLVCDLIKNGEICINEPITLHHNAETGELSIGMSNGEVLTTTLDAATQAELDAVDAKVEALDARVRALEDLLAQLVEVQDISGTPSFRAFPV